MDQPKPRQVKFYPDDWQALDQHIAEIAQELGQHLPFAQYIRILIVEDMAKRGKAWPQHDYRVGGAKRRKRQPKPEKQPHMTTVEIVNYRRNNPPGK